MKENETVKQEVLESINSELFHSFDPDDASWILGGITVFDHSTNGGSDRFTETDIA
jgi:hypothetical protein